jgi:hypothetical protein
LSSEQCTPPDWVGEYRLIINRMSSASILKMRGHWSTSLRALGEKTESVSVVVGCINTDAESDHG